MVKTPILLGKEQKERMKNSQWRSAILKKWAILKVIENN